MKFLKTVVITIFFSLMSAHAFCQENCLEDAYGAVYMHSEMVSSLDGSFKCSEVCIGSTSSQELEMPGVHFEEMDQHTFDASLKNIAFEDFEDVSEPKELIAERDIALPTGRSFEAVKK